MIASSGAESAELKSPQDHWRYSAKRSTTKVLFAKPFASRTVCPLWAL